MTHSSGFSLRPFAPSDAQAAADLLNAAAARTTGLRAAVVDEAGRLRLARYFPAASDRVVAIDPHGRVAAFACLAARDQSIVHDLAGGVHPAHRRKGIGTRLVAWAESLSAARAGRAPAGVKTVLQAAVFEAEAETIKLLDRRGFALVREWVHLAIELDAPPPAPRLPDGLVLRAMDLQADWDLVGPAMDEAFGDHWGAITLPAAAALPEEMPPAAGLPEHESYSNSAGFCFVVLNGDTAAGGILCNARLVERGDTGRVGSLFVRPAYRRQGVARALLAAAFGAFWQHRLRRIVTDTDAESFTQAPSLYARLGMRPYRRELVMEKEIRPGREVRRLAPPSVETP